MLYNIYASDLPSHNNSQVAQYADDTAVYSKHYDISKCTSTITEHLRKITQWCTKWRIKINMEKTQYIVFSKRYPVIPPLQIENRIITPTANTKYLGIYLDRRLNWHRHFDFTKGKVHRKLYQLYPLFRTISLPIKQKVFIYNMYIRAAMLYGAPVWCNAAKEHLHSLQVLQNKIARISTGADFFSRITFLHSIFDTPYIIDVIKDLCRKLEITIKNNTNPVIRSIEAPVINQQTSRK
mgnify:CR=1 FL=1